MKKLLLTFFCTAIYFVCNANIKDSILFSSDGKYLLLSQYGNNFTLICNKDSGITHENIEIKNDSACIFRFKKNIGTITSNVDSFVLNKEQYLLNDFLDSLQLVLKGRLRNDLISIQTDTVKKYRQDNLSFGVVDNYLFYDVVNTISVNQKVVYKDTTTTNIPASYYTDNLKPILNLYISEDNKYFYLFGWIPEETIEVEPGTIVSSPHRIEIIMRFNH